SAPRCSSRRVWCWCIGAGTSASSTRLPRRDVRFGTKQTRCGSCSPGADFVSVAVFTHPDCLRHDPGADHPETPARLPVLLERLRREPGVAVHDAPPAPRPELVAVHRDTYLRSVEALSASGGGALFLDTILNQASWAAALGAAGAALAAVDHVHGANAH